MHHIYQLYINSISGYWLVDKDGNLIPDPAKAPDEPQMANPEDFLTENYEISDLFSSSS